MWKWRLLDVEFPEDPYRNMAVEEAIPLAVGEGRVPPTLRFWRNANAVVIGRFQCSRLEVDFRKCLELGVKVVRRFTGGGAVYHDVRNLNFALALPRPNAFFGDNLFAGFERFGHAVCRGLKYLGVEAKFVPINDVQVEGRKVLGMAGSIGARYLFIHACLLVGSNLKILGAVLKPPKEKLEVKRVRSAAARVTTLCEVLGREVDMREVKQALTRGFAEEFGVELVKGELTAYEQELTDRLYREKYRGRRWNLLCKPCDWCRKWLKDEEFLAYWNTWPFADETVGEGEER